MDKYYYTYIAANQRNTVLYIEVTNNLERRASEHKSKLIKGFTSKYNLKKLFGTILSIQSRKRSWQRKR